MLHADRRINDWAAVWLCSGSIRQYRPYHLQHHRYVQQAEDPDLVLSAPFPITRESLARKAVRDLTGQTFYRQRYAALAHRIRTREPGESAIGLLADALSSDRRFLIGNGLGFALFAVTGYWWVWVVLWLVPMMTWLQLVSRIRNIAEHALVAQDERDPLRQARTTKAGLLERIVVAPYWVNYHCEHHLFTSIPCWNLPRAHALLSQKGALPSMEIEPGYRRMLRRATSG